MFGRFSRAPRRRTPLRVGERGLLVLVVMVAFITGAVGATWTASRWVAVPLRAAVAHLALAQTAATSSRAAHVLTARYVVVTQPVAVTADWVPFAVVNGRSAAWIAQRGDVALMRFDQSLVRLDLHAGSSDGGVLGWTYGDQIAPQELDGVVAGFNGGFKLSYEGGATVGFMANAHVAVPLKPGLASVVTYDDGSTNVGAWDDGVPAARKPVFSVLQNLRLLVNHGVATATGFSCVVRCWGVTVMNHERVARSGLGITAIGQLVWAGGESLLPAELAKALIGAGAQRAIELDINPHWVAAYRYAHYSTGPTATPVVPGQEGIVGQLFAPYSRDFFVMVAR